MGADGQVLLLPRHCQGCQGKGPIIEGQLEGDVDRVEQDLLPNQLDVHLLVVKIPRYLPDLTHCIVDEPTTLGAVVQG